MSPPLQPFSLGKSDDFFDTTELGPELTAPQVTTAPPGMPEPSLGDVVHASRVDARPRRSDFDLIRLRDGYTPILGELGLGITQNPAAFDDPDPFTEARFGRMQHWSQLTGGWAGRRDQEEAIAKAIRDRRAKEPKFAPGVPDTVDGLHTYFQQQEAKNRGEAELTLSRSHGVAAGVASFAGAGIESMHDPVNILATVGTAPIGGGGGLLATFGREALINGTIEALSLPKAAENLEQFGEHMTAGEMVSDVATTAAFGGVFGVGMHAGGKVVAPLLRPAGEAAGRAYDRTVNAVFDAMPAGVQKRWAGKMKAGGVNLADIFADVDNHELTDFAEKTIGPDRMTPEEKASINVLRRSQEVGDASPFEPGPEGDAQHEQGLAQAIQAILDGPRPKVDLQTSTALTPALRSTGSPAPIVHPATVDAHFGAILGNEGGLGRHGEFLTSKKGAIGPAQVMPGTAPYAARLAGLPWDPVKYRSDRGYNEALGKAYYAEQLQTFGDPLKAAAAYNAGPGSAARGTGVRGAIARAERAGEPGNWIAYLPAETLQYVRDFDRRLGGDVGPVSDAAVADDGAAIAAARSAADEAEREGLDLSEQLGRDETGARSRADRQDVPELKRSLFDSDEAYAHAQAELHASLNSDDPVSIPPQSAGNGPPERIPAIQAAPEPPRPGELWKLSEQELQALADEKRLGDREKLLKALGSEEAVKRFNALDRARNSSIDLQRADEASRQFDHEFGDLTAEQERLIYGVGETDAQEDEIRELLRAYSDVIPGDDVGWSAYMAAHAARNVTAAELAKVRIGEASASAQAEYIRIGRAYQNMAQRGVPAAEIPKEMARALVERGGWTPEQASEVIGGFVDDMLGIRQPEPGAQPLLTDTRVDNPALTAFDAANGEGQRAQAESLEHDLRMDAAAAPAKFDPLEHVAALRELVKDRRVKLDGEVLGKELGLSTTQAHRVMGALAAAPNSGVYMSKSGALRRVARRVTPLHAMEFVREVGGVRNDEGHDLRNLGAIGNYPGVINRAGGSVDAVGFKLWERGYIRSAERPTEADTLDFLRNASEKRAYATDDLGTVAELDAARANDADEARYHDEIASIAEDAGVRLSEDELTEALHSYVAYGETPEYAVHAVTRDAAARLLDRAGEETGNDFYAKVGRELYEGDRAEQRGEGPAEAGAGSEGQQNDAPGGSGADAEPQGAAGEPGHDSLAAGPLDSGEQTDPAIAERQRQELGLRAGSPLRPGAIDADGTIGLGLFDAADQPKFRLTEEGEEKPLSDILDELDRDRSGLDALRGCLKPVGGGE